MSRKRRKGDEEELTEDEINIRMWRMKKLLANLDEAQGNGTSMISLIVKPKTQISTVSRMLAEEYGTASNIKSRVNRLSVLEAITSTQQRLKLYNRIPNNGLVIYCGTVRVGENKSKKITIDFEPYKGINTTLYHCGSKFHTEPLRHLLSSNDKFGFVVMDGSGCLFGTLSGNTRHIIHKFGVTLPKKHGRGGQSALRFARLRLEKRRNYLRKVAEFATKYYITNDKPNVKNIILAGSADFKSELKKSELFDMRLRRIVLKVVDVAYGGENGFTKAIELSQECLSNVKFIKEKKIIEQFFTEVAKDTNKFVFGTENTLMALDMGMIKTLIIWENLETMRYCIKKEKVVEKNDEVSNENKTEEEKEEEKYEKIIVCCLEKDRTKKKEFQKDDGSGGEYRYEEEPLLEWLADNFKKHGCGFELITDRSEQGSQYCNAFGGIGGLLRYPYSFTNISSSYYDEDDEKFSDSDEDYDDLDDFI